MAKQRLIRLKNSLFREQIIDNLIPFANVVHQSLRSSLRANVQIWMHEDTGKCAQMQSGFYVHYLVSAIAVTGHSVNDEKITPKALNGT